MQSAIPLRILLANEPRAYCEALGAALGVLRPGALVRAVQPAELEDVLERYAPHLVVCSRLPPSVERLPLAWVVLYPDGAPHAELGLDGQRITASEIQLEDLLALVDRMVHLIQSG